MARELVDDELWEIVRPLLPPPPHKSPAGRTRLDERHIFTVILLILQTGLPWKLLPKEMGCDSGMTCWRRACDWQKAGVCRPDWCGNRIWHDRWDTIGTY